MKKLKSILKLFFPKILVKVYHVIQIRLFGIEYKFTGMNSPDIFDKIYKEAIWGEDKLGNPTSGYGSYKNAIVNPYIKEVKKIIREIHCSTIVDLGCGDFNIGKNFIDDCGKYLACDISRFILKQNRQAYKFENLQFRQINIAEDELPTGNLAFIRLVLQHLSNTEIKNFVDNLNKYKPYKYLLVTEHIFSASGYQPNLDKPSGSNIRLLINSAVEVDKEPFNLEFKSKRLICDIKENRTGNIQTMLYEL